MEYHRKKFQQELTEEGDSVFSSQQKELFRKKFEELYGVEVTKLTPIETYRMTRSAIEIDNRARSIQWDALQSFSRSMKFAFVISAVIVSASSVLNQLLSYIYTPMIQFFEPIHLISLFFTFIFTAYIFHRAEWFYKKGYVNYLIADFCNISDL